MAAILNSKNKIWLSRLEKPQKNAITLISEIKESKYIYFKISVGGHFEIQDGCHKTHKKKWNQPQFCPMGSKLSKNIGWKNVSNIFTTPKIAT